MLRSVDLLKNSSFDEISEIINEALRLGATSDFGYDYKSDFEARFVKKARNPIKSELLISQVPAGKTLTRSAGMVLVRVN